VSRPIKLGREMWSSSFFSRINSNSIRVSDRLLKPSLIITFLSGRYRQSVSKQLYSQCRNSCEKRPAI
jgi:hypothetical protein